MLSKQETLQFKGIAILIMIFLHLFISESNVALCEVNLYFYGKPLVFQLSKFAGICVGLYLFLSGYGLYLSSKSGSASTSWKRILKLYLNFWIVFGVFVSFASILYPERYPGDFREIIKNFTGWHTTYNGEWWFLFPYVLLVLTSLWIFKWIDRCSIWIALCVIGVVYVCSYLTIWFNREYLYTHQLVYMPILYLSCLPSFALGAVFAKYDWFAILKNKIEIKTIGQNILWIAVLVLLLLLRALSPISAVNIICMFLFVSWFAVVRKSRWIIWLLEKLGKQSTNMWLVHTFFCYYLFHDWIYGFKYPIVILLVTVMLSFLSGVIIDMIYQPVQKVIIGKLLKK